MGPVLLLHYPLLSNVSEETEANSKANPRMRDRRGIRRGQSRPTSGASTWTGLPWKRGLIGLGVLYLALQSYPWFINSEIGAVVTSWNAGMLWGVLWVIGQRPDIEGSTLLSSTNEFVVIPECTIFAPLALFVAGLLVFPSGAREKLIGFMAGFIILSVINLVRLLTLYGIAHISPGLFDATHLFFWQPVMAISALVIWGFWAERSSKVE